MVRPTRGWKYGSVHPLEALPVKITSISREAKPESQTGLGSKPWEWDSPRNFAVKALRSHRRCVRKARV